MFGHLEPGFWRIFRRELRQIKKRPRLAFMLLPYPLLLFALLCSIFYEGLPTALPVAIVDQDDSNVSRQISRMVDETPELEIVARLSNLTEAKRAISKGQVYGVVLIPNHTERDLLSGQRPEIVTFYNNQVLTIGGIVSRAANAAVGAFSVGVSIQVRKSKGQIAYEAMEAKNTIPLQRSPLFNPALDYTQFLLSAVMPAVLQIFICASAVMAFARDRHSKGNMSRLVRLGQTPIKSMLGKLAPYALAYLTTLLLADSILFVFFEIPFKGSLLLHLGYTVLFVFSCLSLGTFLALLAKDTLGSLGLVGILTAPAFAFAGISFPRMMMNDFSFVWGGAIPLTPYLQLRTDQVVRGAETWVSLPTLGWLLLLLCLFCGMSLLLLTKQAKTKDVSDPSSLERNL